MKDRLMFRPPFRSMNRFRYFLQRIERGLLEALPNVINPAAKRAVPAMLGHLQMNGLNLGWDFPAGQKAEDVAVFDATVGVDQIAAEPIEIGATKGIHDDPPLINS
jgi:hypothetical protein